MKKTLRIRIRDKYFAIKTTLTAELLKNIFWGWFRIILPFITAKLPLLTNVSEKLWEHTFFALGLFLSCIWSARIKTEQHNKCYKRSKK
jgi:hypothetical protein